MKRCSFLLMMMFFIYFQDGFAQIKRRPVSKLTEKSKQNDILDKLTFDIKLGNVGFFRNLYLSTKLNAGYKVNDWFSTGLGTKLFYTQIFITGAPDDTYVDWGGFVYARAKVFKNFFGQVEYNYTSYAFVNSFYSGANIHYPTVGGGYMSGSDKWSFGIELNLVLNELARDYQGSVLEYWFGAVYHF
ncbi:MAG: hypothetical protein WAT79_05880 [Saprospiraceae bacterium]